MVEHYRTEVQKALRTAALAGPFYPVTYADHVPVVADGVGEAVQPAAALANEIGGAFGLAERRGRGLAGERESWAFQLELGFNQEVLLDRFEEVCLETPIRVKPVGLRTVLLFLQEKAVRHPRQNGPVGGTGVTYTFLAQVQPG